MSSDKRRDWKSLSDSEFEELCTALLSCMKFEDVRLVAGPGDKGRDITCRKDVLLAPSLTRSTTWIVQCKHTDGRIKKGDIYDDLASTMDDPPDFWLLMTSGRISSAIADWLKKVERTKYSFGIEYFDQRTLSRLLTIYPQVAVKYFPSAVSKGEAVMTDVMQEMNRGNYKGALNLLKPVLIEQNPRLHYLAACCHSVLASSEEDRSRHLQEGFTELEKAARLGYLKLVSSLFKWPESKVLFEVDRDPELQFLKTTDLQRFRKSFPEPKGGGGGCFLAGTRVKLIDRTNVAIEKLQIGSRVLGVNEKGQVFCGIISARYMAHIRTAVSINKELVCSLDQPLLTERGWIEAGNIRIGQILAGADGPVFIHDLRFLVVDQSVYSVVAGGTKCFYAEGYLAHNKEIVY
jgi:hypothetical protein